MRAFHKRFIFLLIYLKKIKQMIASPPNVSSFQKEYKRQTQMKITVNYVRCELLSVIYS
uniref:Uncharacterized protein n=1 Tax=Kuenenia stuttgartiensis TaxID=174633 RepID=Q1Q0L9_KUEST|nr:unknown protein [Candidatus Kuenenia stuttgartiensis]